MNSDRWALDGCAGKGGWTLGLQAAGWKVLGIDIVAHPGYPGNAFLQADIRDVTAEMLRSMGYQFGLAVFSPPCEEFARWSMPWTRAKNPPSPDMSIWRACETLGQSLGVPYVIENVRGAQQFAGKAFMVRGARYLWGDLPALLPTFTERKKESYGSSERMRRAMVPTTLAQWIGETCAIQEVDGG